MSISASFNPNDFQRLIENHGYNAYWSKAIVCECLENGQPDMHCEYCQGKGWRYLPREHVKLVSTSFTGKQELIVPGLKEPGTVYVTPEIEIIMGYYDKIEFYEIDARHSQVIKMGIEETTATFRPINDLNFVLAGDYVYTETVDFIVTADKHHLKWINPETKPKKGTKISILYLTSPEYLVVDMNHELRSTRVSKGTVNPYTAKMPNQYQLRRIDFVYGHTVNAKREEIKIAESEGLSYD
ncbi:MAG: hypothetical protein GXZ11_01395 [Tissierellia bacterium]|nr:hypothetical protein [Tissierellia bacterium]